MSLLTRRPPFRLSIRKSRSGAADCFRQHPRNIGSSRAIGSSLVAFFRDSDCPNSSRRARSRRRAKTRKQSGCLGWQKETRNCTWSRTRSKCTCRTCGDRKGTKGRALRPLVLPISTRSSGIMRARRTGRFNGHLESHRAEHRMEAAVARVSALREHSIKRLPLYAGDLAHLVRLRNLPSGRQESVRRVLQGGVHIVGRGLRVASRARPSCTSIFISV